MKKPLIVCGSPARGKSTLIRKIADAHGVPVMAAPRSVNEYEAMWRRLDNGDTVVFDDWSGSGRLFRDLQLISVGMSTKWRRTGTCDKVDELRPKGWIVVALRSSSREIDLTDLRGKCEILTPNGRRMGWIERWKTGEICGECGDTGRAEGAKRRERGTDGHDPLGGRVFHGGDYNKSGR